MTIKPTPEDSSFKGVLGGYRPGAGRPKGRKNLAQVKFKKTIREMISPTEVKMLVTRLYKWSKTDKKVAMFLAEQVFGKAKVTTEGLEGKTNNIAIFLDNLEKPKLPPATLGEQYGIIEGEIIDGSETIGQKLED